MEYSHNVLVMDNLSVYLKPKGETVSFLGEIKATIKFFCPVTGNHYKSIVIISQAVSSNCEEESLRNAIEKMFNGYFNHEIIHHERKKDCHDSSFVHSLEPFDFGDFDSLFKSIFDFTIWEIPSFLTHN